MTQIKMAVCLSQALEVSMKDRKKDLEELLAHSIELQRRHQLLPQEKVDVEPLHFTKYFSKIIDY